MSTDLNCTYCGVLYGHPHARLCPVAGTAASPVQGAASATTDQGAAPSDGDLLHLFDCYGNACYNRPSNQYDFRTRFLAALDERAQAAQPSGVVHPDDLAVDKFASAMKMRMAEQRKRGRRGWDDPAECSLNFLMNSLRGVPLSRPVDIGNYAMMLFNRAAMENEGYPIKVDQEPPRDFDFDEWQSNPYTKALLKSISDDYIPRIATPAPEQEATQAEQSPGAFFNILPTITPEQESAAEKGFCPACNAVALKFINRGEGMRFFQCAKCKDITVLSDAAPVAQEAAQVKKDGAA